MTLQEFNIQQNDTVVLNNGNVGTVISYSPEQVYENGQLRDTIMLDVETPFGVEEVSNEDVLEIQ